MKREIAVISLAVLAGACAKKEPTASKSSDLNALRSNLTFTCVHEASNLPKLDPDADKLFLYARYLQKREGQKDLDDIMRYYRIAAAYGHYKANHNAQLLIAQGLVLSPEGRKEAVDLAMQLVHNDIPGGYYDIGHYLETGYGVQKDILAALRNFRKAADLGNPEAQDYIAEKLLPDAPSRNIAVQMWQCAAGQGYGKAANSLGNLLGAEGRFQEAAEAYQRGVAAGNSLSAFGLEKGFTGPPAADKLNYIGLPNDPERSARYVKIRRFFERNDGRNPTVPDIDKIAPLPPTPLPPWDGTFQWEKEQAAAKPPEKPSEELIDRLAKKKHLDPATGSPQTDSTEKMSVSAMLNTPATA